MSQCTWVDCKETANHIQKSQNGDVWAKLCEAHHFKLEDAIRYADNGVLMSRYIKASGGAKVLAKTMADDFMKELKTDV
jgi:hypothetical protein